MNTPLRNAAASSEQRPLFRLLAIALLALPTLLVGACAAIYRPAPFWGANGYSSHDIDATTVTVNYLTGTGADRGLARDYAMYRCAEIALERGFDGFLVLKADAFGVAGPYGSTTSSTVTMRMFKGAAPERSSWPAGTSGAFNARVVRARLESRIERQ